MVVLSVVVVYRPLRMLHPLNLAYRNTGVGGYIYPPWRLRGLRHLQCYDSRLRYAVSV